MTIINDITDWNECVLIDGKTLVKFGAKWCSPCKAMKPILTKFEEETNIEVLDVDIDNPDISDIIKDLNIMSIPTLFLYENGNKIKESKGVSSIEELKELFVGK